jgi:hypothetical protein
MLGLRHVGFCYLGYDNHLEYLIDIIF